ncbi:MAG: hypothetical protein V4479_04125 [Actinomycetota bacterium]
MELSRKRKKELKKLRSAASDLWDDQKDILEHASRVVRDAGHHASDLGHDAAESARGRVNNDVLPAVSSAIASALALLEVAKDPRVKAAIAKVGQTRTDVGARFGVKEEKQAGPGRYILIGLGLVAVAGVAYAAWQTLRADDELWVSSDDDAEEPAAS